MPINGWYAGNQDNVLDDNNVNGWADQSNHPYGTVIAGGVSYRFGPVIGNYGTWGQLIYSGPNDLAGQDLANPSGLNGHMPGNPAPDGSIWVQGHLINGECGGHGTVAHNLTPISHKINMGHAGYEGVLQLLVNRGAAGAAIMFNPNNIANSRLIYRTHALPPAAPNAWPTGVVVSLGVVINGNLLSGQQLNQHFLQTPQQNQRWFNNFYYGGGTGANHRMKIVLMAGGCSFSC